MKTLTATALALTIAGPLAAQQVDRLCFGDNAVLGQMGKDHAG